MKNEKIISEVKLSSIFDNKSFANLLLWFNFKSLILLYRLFGHNRDGWRKVTEANHRLEEARYAGSLSNLSLGLSASTPGSKEFPNNFSIRLYTLLQRVPYINFALDWKPQAARLIPYHQKGICWVRFNEENHLVDIVPYPAIQLKIQKETRSETIQEALHLWTLAYNQTIHLKDKQRPIKLKKTFIGNLEHQGWETSDAIDIYCQIAHSFWFTTIPYQDSYQRYNAQLLNTHKNAGSSILNFEIRYQPGNIEFDFWIKPSHIAMDGRFARKLIKSIKKEFVEGSKGHPFLNPAIVSLPFYKSSPKDKSFYQGGGFINLDKILLRKMELQKMGIDTTLEVLVSWELGKHPFFKDKKINIPVNIPAQKQMPATLGFVFLRPSAYHNGSQSFSGYNLDFNHQAINLINRKGEGYELTMSAAVLPYWANNLVNRLLPQQLQEITGSLSFTIMPDLEVIFPTLSDNIGASFAISFNKETSIGFVGIRSFSDNIIPFYNAVKTTIEE